MCGENVLIEHLRRNLEVAVAPRTKRAVETDYIKIKAIIDANCKWQHRLLDENNEYIVHFNV